MLKRIIAFSLQHAGLVVLLSIGLLMAAYAAIKDMPVDVFPELNAPSVTIISESGGLSAEEVEQMITFPIETVVKGIPGLRRVRSASSLGLSIVWVEFAWGEDIYRARQMVSERLTTVQEDLPEDVHMQMAPISSITGEIMLLSLSSDPESKVKKSPMDLRSYAEYDLRNRLLTVSGISQVVAIGGLLPEYQVEYDQESLRLYDLSAEDLSEALAESHNTSTAGFLPNVKGLELPMQQTGRVADVKDVEQAFVTERDGAVLRIEDVAEVKLGGAMRRGSASDQGREAVVLSVQKSPGTNTLEITAQVDKVLDQVEAGLPEGMLLNRHVFRQANFIRRSVDNVKGVLLEASIIVSLVLIMFLMNLRTTLITLVALPVSLGVALLVMYGVGMSINVMTLGGLAVAIGVLVDDSIIDVENVYRRLAQSGPIQKSSEFLKVIYRASNEIRSSIVFATVIICMVFVPLLFLEGLEGRFFKPLGWTYIISVMASLAVAMTLTPALCALLLKRGGVKAHSEGWCSRWVKAMYRPILNLCLKAKALTLSVSLAMTMATMALFSSFGSSFLPEFNEGTYTLFLMMPPGTSLDESERIAQNVQRELLRIEGVEHSVARSGRAERDEHAEPPSSSEVEVRLKPEMDPKVVLRDIDRVLAELPGVTTSVGQPISHRLSHVMSGTKAQVAIDIYGDSLEVLRDLSQRVTDALKKSPQTRDVAANREVLIQTLSIDFDLEALARMGISVASAGEQVNRALYGENVKVIHQGARRFSLTLRLKEEMRDSVADVSEVILRSKTGAWVRLKEVADIQPEQRSNLISRQNAMRKAVISTNVAEGYSLGEAVASIREIVEPMVTEVGYAFELSGQFKAQQSAQKTLMTIGVLTFILMFVLLQMSLQGWRPALLVMLNLPLALIGGVLAMLWTESDAPLQYLWSLVAGGERIQAPVVTIASLVGFITLFGIAVRNGILLVNHFRWLRLVEGLELREAVLKGSMERLIPVLMTALSAMLGLVPLALKMGQPGSELLAPLAIVVLGGLFSSTLLNMLVVPVGYICWCAKVPEFSNQKDEAFV